MGTPLASRHASAAGSRPGSSPAAAVRARTPGSRPMSVASAPASPPALTAVRSASTLGSPVPARTSLMRSATFAAPDRRSLAGSMDAREELHVASDLVSHAPSESAASTAPQTPDTRHGQAPRPGSGQPQHEWTSLADRMWKPRPALKDHGLEELDVYDIPIKVPMLPREPLMVRGCRIVNRCCARGWFATCCCSVRIMPGSRELGGNKEGAAAADARHRILELLVQIQTQTQATTVLRRLLLPCPHALPCRVR